MANPKQLEAVNDAHLMWSLQSAAQHLTGAAIYMGMAREGSHWIEDARRELAHAKDGIAKFEAELEANIADPEGSLKARAVVRDYELADAL